jgi:hypothetical protein
MLATRIANAFHGWDEYQLRKHWGSGQINVRSLLKLTRPKARGRKEALLWGRAVREGKQALAVPNTWETRISAIPASDKEARKGVWMDLIRTGKLPTLATLRNLRNMVDDGVPLRVLDEYIRGLRPRYMRIFPAVKAMAAAPQLTLAIEEMLRNYAGTSRQLRGLTEIVIDVSGSMGSLDNIHMLTGSVNVVNAISVAYALMLASEHYRLVLTAGHDGKRLHKSRIVTEKVVTIHDLMAVVHDASYKGKRSLGGGGIFTAQVVEWLRQTADAPDRIVVISDSQDMDYGAKRSRRRGHGVHHIEVNVASYKHVHITDKAYGGIWTVIQSATDPAPFIAAVEKAGCALQ